MQFSSFLISSDGKIELGTGTLDECMEIIRTTAPNWMGRFSFSIEQRRGTPKPSVKPQLQLLLVNIQENPANRLGSMVILNGVEIYTEDTDEDNYTPWDAEMVASRLAEGLKCAFTCLVVTEEEARVNDPDFDGDPETAWTFAGAMVQAMKNLSGT